MSQRFFNDDLNVIRAENEKKIAEQDLMLEAAIADGMEKKAETELQIASSIIEKDIVSAAAPKQLVAAQPSLDMKTPREYIDDYTAKMTSPRAAELKEPAAAEPDYSYRYRPRKI